MAAPKRPVRRRSSTIVAPRRPQPPAPQHRRTTHRYTPPPASARAGARAALTAPIRLALPIQALLLAGLLSLGAIAVLVGGGGVARTLAGVGGALGDVVTGFVNGGGTPKPTGAPGATAAPRLDPPGVPYTAQATIDITGRLPSGVAGTAGARIRIYVGGKFAVDTPVPTTTDFRVPAVPLLPGRNDVSATVMTAAGESEPSDPVSVTFLNGPPQVSLTLPKDGATVQTPTTPVRGTTRPGARITVRNASTGGTSTALATDKGSFAIENVGLAEGPNALTVTAVDQAGNTGSVTVTVIRGSGNLSATLTLSWYTMKASKLAQQPLTMTVRVLDVNGKAVADSTLATFSISPLGQPTTVSDPQPTRVGVASWKITLPSNSSPGSGFVTVQVQLVDGRVVTATANFTITS